MRSISTALVGAAVLVVPAVARADEPASDPYAAFPMTEPHSPHYVRAGLEVGGILAVGLVDYLLNTNARGGTLRAGETRWGLRYDWPTLHDKLVGTGLNLDTNKMPTNYASHPLAGTLYYTVARSNHLSFAESFIYATLGSTTWEYFGEIREITSINDLLVTPVSGAAIGEPLLQLASFFDRGDKRASNRILAAILGPTKEVNEWFDDAHPLRSAHVDAYGFPTDVWHRFTIAAGGGATEQGGKTYADETLGIDLRVANLPGYGGAGKESHLYDDGNMAGISWDMTMSQGQLVDALFATRVVPIGYYHRDARLAEDGSVDGTGSVVGLRMGFEYGMHDYDRDRSRSVDLATTVSPIGIAAEHVFEHGGLEVRTGLDVFASMTGITPYALAGYRRLHGDTGLLSPIREQGYYHALGIHVTPTLDVAYGSFRWTTRLRLDSFRAIQGVDANEGPLVDDSIRIADRRSLVRSTLAFQPRGTALRFALDGSRRLRAGDVGEASAERTETSFGASLGVSF